MYLRTPSRKELSRKEDANLEEWKKFAAKSREDLALVENLEKLMQVKHELDGVKQKTLTDIRKLKDSYEKKVWKKKLQLKDDEEMMKLYEERSRVIELIPKFWSNVFKAGFQSHLNDKDKEVIEYLKSLVVKGRPCTSECTIILEFDQNPYFKNSRLTKTFYYSHDGITDSSGTKIEWKAGEGITAGPEEKRKSFFTWFEESTKERQDVVANVITSNLWRYAPSYFQHMAEQQNGE
ncbi:hypothetical protein MKW94_015171 [Papaver nudicaule]|uniref:Uncharacterized protein n=1 Tax=Papaver nudicaule TaxID=74823 RepID=A0AA42B1Q1_PAPNU|nr:hypothetical protein [Papaver nudicaule]